MTITEVSRRYGLSADTLRYYERVGLIPAVHRTPGGIRDYTDEDCSWVEFVKCMRSSGLPVEAVSEYVSLSQQGDSTYEARRQLLIEQRRGLEERMAEMQRSLDRLDEKIRRYDLGLAGSAPQSPGAPLC